LPPEPSGQLPPEPPALPEAPALADEEAAPAPGGEGGEATSIAAAGVGNDVVPAVAMLKSVELTYFWPALLALAGGVELIQGLERFEGRE